MWSKISAEHEVIYTGNGRPLATPMPKTSGVAELFYGLVIRLSGPKIRQEVSSA